MRTQKYTAIIAILFITLAGVPINVGAQVKRPCALTDAHWRAIQARFAALTKAQAELKLLLAKMRRKGTIGGPSAKEITALRASLKAVTEELAALTAQLKKTPRGASICAKELAAIKALLKKQVEGMAALTAQLAKASFTGKVSVELGGVLAALTALNKGIEALTAATTKGDDRIVAELKTIQGQLNEVIAAIKAIRTGTPGDRLPAMFPSKRGPLAGPHFAALATGTIFAGGDEPGGVVGLVQLTLQGEYIWPVNVGLYGALHFGAALLSHEDLAMFAMSASGGMLFVVNKYFCFLVETKYNIAFNPRGHNPYWTTFSPGIRVHWKKFALVLKGGLTIQSDGIPAANGGHATLDIGVHF